MTWNDILNTSIDAWLYGFFGALAGALVTWVLGRKLWHRLAAKLDAHTAATNRLAASHEQQAAHLATIAASLQRTGTP